jgi:dipeptidyl aminopeptidase/acylaminoacyl peptidase
MPVRPLFLTLHGTLDALLTIGEDSDVYRQLILDSGTGNKHRYHVIAQGNHADSYYDNNEKQLRPILPGHRDAI